MSSAAEKSPLLTAEEYLAQERVAAIRSEYVAGKIFAMPGGSFIHGLITGNLLAVVCSQMLGRPCRVFNNVKIWAGHAEMFAYPDVSALCGNIEPFGDANDVIANPSFIAEVLSPSTAQYDIGEKFRRYRNIASFREYLIVEQEKMGAELHVKQDDGSWQMRDYEESDSEFDLPSIDCRLRLGDLYDKVDFDNPLS